MQQTVTVRGFAWNSTTRTHSDVVTYEAVDRREAQAWVERMSSRLQDCAIIRNNDQYILSSLLQFGALPESLIEEVTP